MDAYMLDDRGLEENADAVKALILGVMVNDGLLDVDTAEEWAKTHTVIVRRKTFFRTITNLWREQQESGGIVYHVVKVA